MQEAKDIEGERGILRDQIALGGAQGLRLALGLLATILLMRFLPDALWAGYVLFATGLALALQIVDAGLGGPLAAVLAREGEAAPFRRRVGRVRTYLALGATAVGFGAAMRLGILAPRGLEGIALLFLAAAILAAPLRASASALVAGRRETPRALFAVLSQLLFVGAITSTFGSGAPLPETLFVAALIGLGLRELTSSFGLAYAERRGRSTLSKIPAAGDEKSTVVPQTLAPVLFASAVGALYLNADVFIVAWLGDATEVARYGDASRLASPLFVLPALVISPLTRAISRGTRGDLLAATLIALTPLVCGLCALASASETVIAFVRDRAAPASAAAFVPLALAGIGIVAGQVGSLALHARDASKIWARVAVLGLILNVGLDVALVPFFGAQGAAWATLVTELVVGATALTLAVVRTRPDTDRRAALVPASLGLAALSLATYLCLSLSWAQASFPVIKAAAVGLAATFLALLLPGGRRLRRELAESAP